MNICYTNRMNHKLLNSKFLRPTLTITTATLWIAVSEFVRNQLIFKSFWVERYASLGLIFPEKTINGALWGVWSLGLAIVIYTLASRFSPKQTIAISWTSGFVLMWVVIGNLGVLPIKLLIPAIPLSLLEVAVATLIVIKLQSIFSK